METITRNDLGKLISKECDFPRFKSLKILDTVLVELCEILKEKEEIKIPLFGVFFVRHKKERVGRNPRTLELARISARRVVGFRASRLMKTKVISSLR